MRCIDAAIGCVDHVAIVLHDRIGAHNNQTPVTLLSRVDIVCKRIHVHSIKQLILIALFWRVWHPLAQMQ